MLYYGKNVEDNRMKLQKEVTQYLEYCEFRKVLDRKTIKAYRIDLKQYFEFLKCDEPNKNEIEK